ncbi:MAG: cell wall hydrolase/autolysin [Firmicutes bacterium]|nr:cell wall hydrolase/autolysin [Bacillota bacterium]
MNKQKILLYILLVVVAFGALAPVQISYAASANNILSAITAPTTTNQPGGGILNVLFDLVFKKLLGPILNIFDGKSTPASVPSKPVTITKVDTTSAGTSLLGKVIVVDPGHGGSNPGAVANNTKEADNNLAVGLKLKTRLEQAGAKVIMSRDTDRTVAPEGKSLGEELQARVDLVEANNANIFVSIHSNSSPDTAIAGAMTFYPQGTSSRLAEDVGKALINSTQAVNKGTSPANFYVLRKNTVPSTLIEMGFVSNAEEAAKLATDAYREKIADGIFAGIVQYFKD